MFVTPFIISLVIVIVLLAIGGGFVFGNILQKKSRDANRLKILRVKPSRVNKKLPGVLRSLRVPLAFEAVVEQFGREIKYYVVTLSQNVPKIIHILEAQEVDDYDIYRQEGVNVGGYIKTNKTLSSIEFDKIDFSKVNSVGEGAMVQFLFGKRQKGGVFLNIRAFVSTSSSYQAKEILDALRSTMPGNLVDVKSDDFINKVHLREFDAKEQLFFKE